MPQKTNKLPEFSPDLNSPAELAALGGCDKLLDYYSDLVEAVNATPSPETDRYRPLAASRLRAGMKFLFGMAGINSRAEFASASYDRCAPKDKRKEIAARATVVLDDALAALKLYDQDITFRTVF